MASPSWFQTSAPPLNQLGATMGSGVTPAVPNAFNNPQYQQWLNDQAEEQRRQADQLYHQRQQELNQNYNIAKRNAKTNEERQALDKWYQQQNVKLAQDRLAEEHRQFDATFGLNQARLGYDVLNMASNLRGPQNYFQASNFARGVNAQPGTAAFLTALQNNAHLSGFGAQAGSPTAVSLGNILGGSGVGQAVPAAGAAGTSPDDQLLAQIHGIGAAGAGRLGAGSLEQLSPTEQSLFGSGLEAPDANGKAFDLPTFLDQYRRSRIGQSVGGNFRAA